MELWKKEVENQSQKCIHEHKKVKNEFVIYCSSEAAITNTLEIYPFYASILPALLLCCS